MTNDARVYRASLLLGAIRAKTSVDRARVVIGGFPSGGYATMLSIFDGAPAAAGFAIPG
jgi:hypothetical protein